MNLPPNTKPSHNVEQSNGFELFIGVTLLGTILIVLEQALQCT